MPNCKLFVNLLDMQCFSWVLHRINVYFLPPSHKLPLAVSAHGCAVLQRKMIVCVLSSATEGCCYNLRLVGLARDSIMRSFYCNKAVCVCVCLGLQRSSIHLNMPLYSHQVIKQQSTFVLTLPSSLSLAYLHTDTCTHATCLLCVQLWLSCYSDDISDGQWTEAQGLSICIYMYL